MQMNVEHTLLIRSKNPSSEDAYSADDRRRRTAATAKVNAELEK